MCFTERFVCVRMVKVIFVVIAIIIAFNTVFVLLLIVIITFITCVGTFSDNTSP